MSPATPATPASLPAAPVPPPPPYADLSARLAGLRQQAAAAYLRHARCPRVVGSAGVHAKLWGLAYEARAALAERNPAFAQTLLPLAQGLPGYPAAAPGLPLVPAGVRWAVDEAGRGQVTVSVEVGASAGVSLRVRTPEGRQLPTPALTSTATRTTTTFAAPSDGLYLVTLAVGGATLAVLYVPVSRAEFRLFREDSRALRFAFGRGLPRPGTDYRARLARLIAAEAAARCGQPDLSRRLLAAARAVPAAPTPTALFPD